MENRLKDAPDISTEWVRKIVEEETDARWLAG